MTLDREPCLLFVCTANVCRSPMAAGFMAKHATQAGIGVVTSSASVDPERRTRHPLALTILEEHGITLGQTNSRTISREQVEWADLILTMTGDHAIRVASRFRDVRAKVFKLDHFAQIVRPLSAAESVDEWLRHFERQPRSYPSHPGAEDIADPMGKDEAIFRSIAADISELTNQIAAALAT